MRIKEEFAANRISEIKNPKPKFIIASEGSNSEPQYFEGLNKSVISENITIINLLRDYAYIRNSHPSFIIRMLEEFILNTTSQEITVKELKNKIDNCIYQYQYDIDIDNIHKQLILLYKNDDYRIKNECLNELFLNLFKSEIYKDLAENFPLYFEAQNVTYSKETDRLNMVIDRDKQNVKDYQYDEVVNFCQANEVNLYVSNPNFEFFLMLHFPEVLKEDKVNMLENKYITRSKRYLEKRLYDICKYNKAKLDFKSFEPYIYDAIKREELYQEDIIGLKNELGSNVGLLIKDMLCFKLINNKKN